MRTLRLLSGLCTRNGARGHIIKVAVVFRQSTCYTDSRPGAVTLWSLVITVWVSEKTALTPESQFLPTFK